MKCAETALQSPCGAFKLISQFHEFLNLLLVRTRVLHSASVARRLFIAAIIAISLGAPIAEMFDRWDQTFKDGNDTEANAVVAALCVGVAFAIGTIVIAGRIRALSSTSAGRVITTRAVVHDVASALVPVPTSSPPTVLRV